MDKVILFGAGKDGIAALKCLGNKVAFMCDNSYEKRGWVDGVEVVAFDELKKRYNGEKVLITAKTGKSVFEIIQLLQKHNFKYDLFDNYTIENIRKDGTVYNSLNKRDSFFYSKENEYIMAREKYLPAGNLGSYFFQDLWAAKHIFENQPEEHFDIGSRIDGFIAHLLSFGQNVTQIDIRPMDSQIDGWKFIQSDATNMDNIQDGSIESLSALCSLEHFGLGRYGDAIDPEACFKCFKAIIKKTKKGGRIYISVPIGKEHLEFNAHRIFYPTTIINEFDGCNLLEFSVANKHEFIKNADVHQYDDQWNKSGSLFGLFLFERY